MTVGNTPPSDLVQAALEQLANLLPHSWKVTRKEALRASDSSLDGVLEIIDPRRDRARLVLECRNVVRPADVASLSTRFARTSGVPTVVAPFLSSRTQVALADAGLCYLDLTGNMRIFSDEPPFFIFSHGADKDPFESQQVRRGLRGPKAARIVRTLCDFRPPLGIRQLAELSQVDPGYASRIVSLLTDEGLVSRSPRGGVDTANWRELILRLADEYSLLRSNKSRAFLEPRGIPALERRLKDASFELLLTGSIAASKVNPAAPVRLAVIYVRNIEQAASELILREVDAGANVILVEPRDPMLFKMPHWINDSLRSTGLSQIVVDLMTGPGRGPAEAAALMEWMELHENEWRRTP